MCRHPVAAVQPGGAGWQSATGGVLRPLQSWLGLASGGSCRQLRELDEQLHWRLCKDAGQQAAPAYGQGEEAVQRRVISGACGQRRSGGSCPNHTAAQPASPLHPAGPSSVPPAAQTSPVGPCAWTGLLKPVGGRSATA